MINYAVIRKESLRSFFWLTFFIEFDTFRKDNNAMGSVRCMYKEM